jgi:hypothetical protein
MKRHLILAATLALAAAGIAAPASAEPPTGCPGTTNPILMAMLEPTQEIVGPGDANENGLACSPGGRTGTGAIVLFDDRT